jgi:hypothetical protein
MAYQAPRSGFDHQNKAKKDDILDRSPPSQKELDTGD